MKRIFISDIHMSDTRALGNENFVHISGTYTWLDRYGVRRLAQFLQSPEVQGADQLVLVGDIVDTWVHPISVRPPTVSDILNDRVNLPVVVELRMFAATPGKQLIWIPGNHDMATTADDVHRAIGPQVVFGKQLDLPPLRVRHGHEGSLFNAPDPAGRPFPIGYFITRMTATGVASGHAPMNLDLWTVLKNSSDVLKALRGSPISQCVFDVVMKATGVQGRDLCVLPGGAVSCSVDYIRTLYDSLVNDWSARRGDFATAVEAEWDPWYDLPAGRPHINIIGHSHHAMSAQGAAYGAYLNTGTWISSESTPSYVAAWEEDGGATQCAQVVHWSNGSVAWRSSISRLPR